MVTSPSLNETPLLGCSVEEAGVKAVRHDRFPSYPVEERQHCIARKMLSPYPGEDHAVVHPSKNECASQRILCS